MKWVSRGSMGVLCGVLGAVLSACGQSGPMVVTPSEPVTRTGTLQIGTSLGNTLAIPFTLVID